MSSKPASRFRLSAALAALIEDEKQADTVISLDPGDVLYEPAHPPDRLYLLAEGLIRVSEPRAPGRPLARTLDWFGPGSLLGLAMLCEPGAGAKHIATAERPSRALPLPVETLREHIHREPEFALELLRQLARRLHDAGAEAGELTRLDAPRRLAAALGRLADQPALADAEGDWLTLRLTHADLASRTGISRETVSLILSRWRREGAVRTGRRRLSVHRRRLAKLNPT